MKTQLMKFVTTNRSKDVLMEVAAGVCAMQQIDFESLDKQQTKGLLSFWCSTCGTVYPLTDLFLMKKKTMCNHCNNSVKLRASSNKFGKLRRNIFYRLLELGIVKVIRTVK